MLTMFLAGATLVCFILFLAGVVADRPTREESDNDQLDSARG